MSISGKLSAADLHMRFVEGDMTPNPGGGTIRMVPPKVVCTHPNPPGCRGLRNQPQSFTPPKKTKQLKRRVLEYFLKSQ